MADLPAAKVASEGAGRRKPYRRKLKNFLLDRGLQLRYILTITLVSALIAGALGFLIWRQGSQTSSDLVEMTERTFGADGSLDDDVSSHLTENDNKLVYQMVAFGLGIAFILSFFLLIMTHKVAGPLFKLSHHFDDLARGKFRVVRPLRRLDMLHSFHTKFEETHAALRARLEGDLAAMEKVVAAAQAAGVAREGAVGEALAAFERHLEERSTSIERG